MILAVVTLLACADAWDWPKEEPTGVLVVVSAPSPSASERAALAAVSSLATGRGLVVVFREASGGEGPDLERLLEAIHEEVGRVERKAGKRLSRRHIVGTSEGATLVGAARQRELLAAFTRVGIIGAWPADDLRRVGNDVRSREVRSRAFDEERARDFFEWFWDDDVEIAQPRVRPP